MKKVLIGILLLVLTAGCAKAPLTEQPARPGANFPTAAPETLPLCFPEDLSTSSNHSRENGTIVLGVTLTNKSNAICTLANPPVVNLLEASQIPIDVHPQELTAGEVPPALVALPTGESVILSLIWQNYCLTPLTGALTLRLGLAGGKSLDVKMDLPKAPACPPGQQNAALLVAPYSYPP
jgi:hypothetical protein